MVLNRFCWEEDAVDQLVVLPLEATPIQEDTEESVTIVLVQEVRIDITVITADLALQVAVDHTVQDIKAFHFI